MTQRWLHGQSPPPTHLRSFQHSSINDPQERPQMSLPDLAAGNRKRPMAARPRRIWHGTMVGLGWAQDKGCHIGGTKTIIIHKKKKNWGIGWWRRRWWGCGGIKKPRAYPSTYVDEFATSSIWIPTLLTLAFHAFDLVGALISLSDGSIFSFPLFFTTCMFITRSVAPFLVP